MNMYDYVYVSYHVYIYIYTYHIPASPKVKFNDVFG